MKPIYLFLVLLIIESQVYAQYENDMEEDTCTLLPIPSAFSPNGDGVNDCIGTAYDCPLDFFTMYVFNRWGEIMYESYNIDDCWDGTFDKQQVQSGIYTWKIILDRKEKEKQEYVGHITVIR